MTEEWRPVLGYEGFYEASSLGRVRSLSRMVLHRTGSTRRWRGRVLKPRRSKGYCNVSLSRDGIVGVKKVATLICEAFHGPRPDGKEVAHEDGVRDYDAASNLSWKTHTENEADKVRHGTSPGLHNAPKNPARGTRANKSNLTEDDVRKIRSLEGLVGPTELGRRHDVSKTAIILIWKRRNWGWLI